MTDYCCYKYRAINKYLIDSLIKSQLFFAPRKQLNDPFDCNIDISGALDRLLQPEGIARFAEGKTKFDRLKKLRENEDDLDKFNIEVEKLGICSFSLTLDETLMWSHYANDHKGVCLRYDFSEANLNNLDEIIGVSRVSYEPNNLTDWLFSHIDLYDSDRKTYITSLLKSFITSKAPSWRYEKEARIIRQRFGLCAIPKETLTHIIFGLQTSDEDESLIRSIAEKYYDSVKFGRIVRSSDDFGISSVET
jgi:hypothetical protein